RLTSNPALDALPAWSPDGTKIVFESDRGGRGNRDIWVMSSSGGAAKRLTRSRGWDVAPDWQAVPRHAYASLSSRSQAAALAATALDTARTAGKRTVPIACLSR